MNLLRTLTSRLFVCENLLPTLLQHAETGNKLRISRVHHSGDEIETMREPLIAGILSLLIPGLGQIYNGRILVGIIWMVLTGFSWIGSAGMLGWIIHLIAAFCAYSYAKEHPVRI
jgi:hypothetical protein